ncbi:MAG: hypothetical protein AAGI48_08020 [Verrucomicrobiota bacterium]
MRLQIEIAGVLLIGLALIHAVFPRYFRWREELACLSDLHREVYKVHTLFIGVTVLLMGILCLSQANELVSTRLGRRVLLGLFLFWFARLFVQFFGYSSSLWRGKRFETTMHVLFSLLWIYLSTVFLIGGLG